MLNRRQFAVGLVAATTAPTLAQAEQSKMLRVAMGGFPLERGHPYSNIQTPAITILSALYDGLTRLTEDGNVAPALATAWRSTDNLTWRFDLRRDVVFSNGKPFDAAAVKFTVDYLAGPGPATEGVRRDINMLAGAAIIDPYTVEIRTKFPEPMFPRSAAVLPIPEPSAWAAMGAEAFSSKPVGTGPFTAESWAPGRVTFRANKTSWHTPHVDGIEFIQIIDTPARLTAMQSGALDVAYNLAPEDLPTIEAMGGKVLAVRDAASANVIFIFGEDRKTPLSDVRVRRALNMAVDRQKIVDTLLAGKTQLSSQPAVRESYGYDESIAPYPYDPAKAKALLKDAGVPNGFAMSLETSGGGTNGLLVTQAIVDDLSRVGVEVTVRQKPVIRYLTDFVRGRYEADALTSQWGSYPTLDAIHMTNIHSCRKDVPWYCDKTIQPVIDAAWGEADRARGLALRHQVMRHYHDQAPGLFLYENVAFIGLSPRTRDFASVYGWGAFDRVKLG